MKLCLVLGIFLFAVSADAGASMHNPHYCFAGDRTKSQSNMMAVITSYESIRRIDFSTVDPFYSLKCKKLCFGNRYRDFLILSKISLARNATRFWYLGKYGIRLPLAPTPQLMIDFVQSSVSFRRNWKVYGPMKHKNKMKILKTKPNRFLQKSR